MIWDGIIALASSKTAITNQIGSSPMRLFPVKLPQSITTYPAVVGRIVTNNITKDFSGASTFDFVPYDFHCYGRTLKDAEGTAELFRDELEGASGTHGGIDFNDVRFAPSGSDNYLDQLELYTYSIEITFNIRR